MKPLDAIDLKILRVLQHEGRITSQAVAEQVGLSPRACLDRIRRLEHDRYLEGYRAIISRRALGEIIVIHAEVILIDQRQLTLQAFERRALQCPEVIACHLLSGPYDYLVRLACRDLEQYQGISDEWINDRSTGVARIVSHSELKVVKEFSGYPL